MSKKVYPVTQEDELLAFLLKNVTDKKRTTIKSYLAHGQIKIGDRICTKFNAPLKPGDSVTLSFDRLPEPFRNPMMTLIYEDDAIIVIDKKSGLLSIGTDTEREKTAYFILSDYVKRSDPDNRIFILHRLDRETSGLMMFAKSEKIKDEMQAAWDSVVLERRYVAVIEGYLDQPQGTIVTYLTDNKAFKVYVTTKGKGAKAITHYKVIKTQNYYTLIEFLLETGKKNQIRVHMEHIGHPIAGDEKYGAQTNPIGRLALHASVLRFVHPVTGKEMSFSTPIPSKFTSIILA